MQKVSKSNVKLRPLSLGITVAIVSLSAIVPLTVWTPSGLPVTGDGFAYLQAANDLNSGLSIDWFVPWPVGYPIFLSLGYSLGNITTFVLVSQMMIAAVLTGASIGLSRTMGLRWRYALAVGVIVAWSPAVYDTARFVYADALFALLCTLAVWALAHSIVNTQPVKVQLLATTAIFCASLTKDLGFVLLVPLSYTLIQSLRRGQQSFWTAAFVGALAITGPLIVWLRRIELGVGDRGLAPVGGWTVERTVGHWLEWLGGLFVPLAFPVVAAVAGFIVLTMNVLSPIFFRAKREQLMTSALFVGGYLAFWSVYLMTSGHHDLEWRYLLPIFPMLTIGVLSFSINALPKFLPQRTSDFILQSFVIVWMISIALRLGVLLSRANPGTSPFGP